MLRKLSIGFITALIMACLLLPAAAFAEEPNGNADPAEQTAQTAERTILMYVCGTDLESKHGMASHNLRQILDSRFSAGENVNFIIMTGGSSRWYLEDSYLSFSDVNPPDDAVLDDEETPLNSKSQISNNYNQIWEAKGADAKTNAGKLVLLDGDGITSDAPIKSEEELVTDPNTLKAFINYGAANYPAEQYDLILWDHGGGPAGGFGADDHNMFGESMPVSGIVDAIRDNAVTNRMDEDPGNDGTFDFIDFDACLMNSIELNLVLADYTNYYIASAEIEPGYGQDYTGWLNMLGDDPTTNAFTLGKQMVDDYYEFYENGKGQGQDGTLAVVDSKALVGSGITAALSDMGALLREQAEDGLFYDEIHASKDSILYQMMNVTDLGNFASLVSITNSEVPEEALDDDSPLDPDNAYQGEEITKNICSVLQNPEIIYARGTSGICSKGQLYRTTSGAIDSGDLSTSGMSFYFIGADSENSIEHYLRYYDDMAKVAEMMPNKNDGRYDFLKTYKDDLMDYALLTVTGGTVNKLIGMEGKSKDEINYDLVKEYLMEGATTEEEMKYTAWTRLMQPLFKRCDGGESAKAAWLETLVKQQAAEAVDSRNVTAKKVKQKNGVGYQIKISNTRNRIIEQVERDISLEVPAIKQYISEHGGSDELLKFGSVSGSLDSSSALKPDADISDIIRWYNGTESTWILGAPEEKWYAIRDAAGNLHAAAITRETDSSITVMTKAGEGENERHLTLTFEKASQADGSQDCKLIEITDVTDSESNRPVNPSELKEAISLLPALSITGRAHGAVVHMYVPTSESAFALSADTASKIALVYTDIKNISDIRDTDGDGTALHSSFSITNIYGSSTDISEVVNDATEQLIDISLARVRIAVHNGETRTPEVVYLGDPLVEGTDYTWDVISSEETELKDVGEYPLLLTGKGRFTGFATPTFRIVSEEDAAAALVEQAQAELNDAKAAMDEAVASGDKTALQTAYARLTNAQNTLSEAEAELIRTKDAQSEENQKALEDKIDNLEKQIKDLTADLAKAKVVDISHYQTSMKTSFAYTGKAIKPSVKVSGLSASVYKVSYSGNTKVGTAKVTIKASNSRYKGTITRTFKILPKKAAVAKVKAGKKKLTVKAKTKVGKTGGTKYQIQYRIKGKSKWKSKTTTKQTLTIKKLKKGKKYQVRIRAFKKVGKKTYYGPWSAVSKTRKIR